MNRLFMHQTQVLCAPAIEVMVGMLPGKVPPELLEKIVFANLGKKDLDILLGPSIGEAASVIRIGV